jgi:hypothetical protein
MGQRKDGRKMGDYQATQGPRKPSQCTCKGEKVSVGSTEEAVIMAKKAASSLTS